MTIRATSVLVGLLLAGTAGYVAIGDEKPNLSSGRIRGYPWRDMIGLCLAAELGIPGALAGCTEGNAPVAEPWRPGNRGQATITSEVVNQAPVPAWRGATCEKFPITRKIDGKSMDGARADGSLDYDSIRKFCAKAADCFIGPRLCDDGKTYPLVDPRIATTDRAEVCGKVDGLSYSRRHRALLTEEDRREDFARAGVPWSQHAKMEDDHEIPLDLGGADVPANRHPQPWSEARKKDRLEIHAGREVCAGRLPLATAQEWFLGNWKDAYRQQFGEEP